MARLTEAQIGRGLRELPGWEYTPQGLRKTVKRRTFKAIMALVNAVAEVAEAMDHHPDIFIHEWNRVTFTIITHSERAVTDRDLALARKVEDLITR